MVSSILYPCTTCKTHGSDFTGFQLFRHCATLPTEGGGISRFGVSIVVRNRLAVAAKLGSLLVRGFCLLVWVFYWLVLIVSLGILGESTLLVVCLFAGTASHCQHELGCFFPKKTTVGQLGPPHMGVYDCQWDCLSP